jgi:sugar O-acyltransferase (sialic acid O-acetyltransferase NeuD family)
VRIIIVGAGGHGQVVADILATAGRRGCDVQVLGFVDDRALAPFGGLPLLGPVRQLSDIDYDAVVVAVGDNAARGRLMKGLQDQGARFVTARHPTAIVSDDVVIGDGSMICAGAIVITGSRIGAGTIVNTGSTLDHHAQVGDCVHVAPGVHVGGEVRIGAGSLIGIGATVLPRVSIGERAIVGAGAVVIRDVPADATVVGNPARIIRHAAATR